MEYFEFKSIENTSLQKEWDSINVNRLTNELQFESDEARVLAIRKVKSGAWLHALQSRMTETLVEDNVFRIVAGPRLGLDICTPSTCICGSKVNKKGRHFLSSILIIRLFYRTCKIIEFWFCF